MTPSPLIAATRGAVLGSNSASATPWDHYYSVNLSAGDVITAGLDNLSGSGTAISLLSPTGASLAGGASGPTNLSQVIGGYSIPAGGTYYFLVTGEAAASYVVLITRNAAFSQLPHGTAVSTQNISGTGSVLGDIGPAAVSSVVVPNANATVMGNTSNGFPFNIAYTGGYSSGMRYQQIYSASQFASAGIITALQFRLGSSASPFSTTGIDVQISLGYAATSVTTASTTFASNDGAGMVTVYNSSSLSLSSTSTSSPRAFDIVINVSPSFNYNPSLGNLIVDISMLNVPRTAQFDAVTGSTTTTRVYGGLTSTTGSISVGSGLVTKFSFAAQQPADWYAINVPTAGSALILATSTPADGPGEFENTLSPHIQLFSPSGSLVATGTVGADGRNETIDYTPPVSGAYEIDVTSKSSTTGEYVLQSVLPGSISGEVFSDLNGNGVLDSGEPGLYGWTVLLDGTPATTNANGDYSFTGVMPGTHTISEVCAGGLERNGANLNHLRGHCRQRPDDHGRELRRSAHQQFHDCRPVHLLL